jgi:protein-L-isoaspartate O-methyltransferase
LVEELGKLGIQDVRILNAFNAVPRHFFMDLGITP